MENNLNVTINPDISIQDLVQRQAEGFSVLRSAHVGNLQPYNMTLASLGIPILSVDHTITGVDKNYFPELIFTRDTSTLAAYTGRLVCKTMTLNENRVETGQYLDEVQINAAREILGTEQIFTNTQYIRDNESIAGDIIGITMRACPQLYQRVVDPAGYVQKGSFEKLIQGFGIMQLADDPRAEEPGLLVPNEVDILINFIVEALNSGRATQYHLSGPDMVQYLKSEQPRQFLSELYQRVLAEAPFANKMPKNLDVQLVPTATAKFATTMQKAPIMTDLSTAIEARQTELSNAQRDRKQFFASPESKDQNVRDQALKDFKARETQYDQAIGELAAELPELFFEPRTPTFVTQYDVKAEGGLFVAPINLSFTMRQLAETMKFVAQQRQKAMT